MESSINKQETEIIFQGQRMFLADILQSESSAVDENSLSALQEIGKTLEHDKPRIHIERKFLPLNEVKGEGIEKSFSHEELLSSVEGKKIVWLIDDSGKGKTTEFRLLAKEMKQKYPKHWLVFLNLIDHVEAFADPISFESSGDIAKFFCEKILKIDAVEAQIFMHLFNEGRVIIMMDAFDEINSKIQENVEKIFNEKNENQIWISTRPKAEDKNLKSDCFKLKPLTFEDQNKFIKTLIDNEADADKEKIREVSSFLSGLNSYRSNQLNNPIIFRLLMEVFEKDIELKKENYYQLYKNFVAIMILKSLSKSQISFVEDIVVLHQKFALISIFEKEMEGSKEIIEKHFKSLPDAHEITKFGLISINGSEEIKFLDLTLSEYFAADFFYRNIFLNDDKNFIEVFRFIWNAKASYSCRMVTKFLNSIFGSLNAEELQKIQATFVRIMPESELQEVFRLAVFDDCLNLIQIISKIFMNRQDILFEMWSVRRYGTNALMMAVKGRSVNNIDRILKIAHEVLDKKHFKKLFQDAGSHFANIYFAAASSFVEGVSSFLMKHELNPLTDKETKDFLTARSGKQNILMKSCEMSSDLRELKTILEVVREKCGEKELKQMMSEVDSSGKSLLFHSLPHIQNPEIFLWLIENFKNRFSSDEIKNIFLAVHKSEKSKFSLIRISMQWTVELWKVFFKFLEEILPEKSERKSILAIDFHGKPTMFYYATENSDNEAFLLLKSKYSELFSEEEMREMILCKDYFSIFFIAVQGFNNVKTIEALWTYMQELFDAETLKSILLKKSREKQWPADFWQSEKRFYEIIAIFDLFINENLTEEEAKAFREIPPLEKRTNPNSRFWS